MSGWKTLTMSMPSITTCPYNKEALIALAAHFADVEGSAFFYSGGEGPCAKQSLLFLFPQEKITVDPTVGSWDELIEKVHSTSLFPQWAGFVGYEMGAFADSDKRIPFTSSALSGSCFYRYACVCLFDHAKQELTVVSYEKHPPLPQLAYSPQHPKGLKLVSQSDTLESYCEKIAFIQEKIREGDVYQVNLSQAFRWEGETTPFAYFDALIRLNPAPFSAYFKLEKCAVVSSSPERLFSKSKERIETRPIKGTMPRGKDPAEDLRNQNALISSEKERSELLMITDLMRNDLGKKAIAGSVVVPECFRLEAYSNVFHLVSVIEAKVKEQNPFVLLRTLFPGGSVTGCPKLAAMEAIHLLEKRARGIYTGSIGYLSHEVCDFNIAIRTLVVYPDYAEMQVGGAIVIDSDPLREYQETLHKGRSLFKVLGKRKK